VKVVGRGTNVSNLGAPRDALRSGPEIGQAGLPEPTQGSCPDITTGNFHFFWRKIRESVNTDRIVNKGGGRRWIKGRYDQRLPSVSFALGLNYVYLNYDTCGYQENTVFFVPPLPSTVSEWAFEAKFLYDNELFGNIPGLAWQLFTEGT